MYKITTTFLFCASLLMAQDNLSLSQKLQSIDKEEESLLSSFKEIREKRELSELKEDTVKENNNVSVEKNTELDDKRFEQVASDLEMIQKEVEEEKKIETMRLKEKKLEEEKKAKKELIKQEEKKVLQENTLEKQRVDQKKLAAQFLAEKEKYDKIEKDKREVQEKLDLARANVIAQASKLDVAIEEAAHEMEASVREEMRKRADAEKMAEAFLIEKKKYDEKEANANNETSVDGQYYIVTAHTLNVRSKASKNSKRVTKVYKNQKVKIVKKSGDWFYISKKGWVHSKYLKKS